MSFLRIFQVMGFVSEWCSKALEDGKVTTNEIMELGMGLCEVLGIKVEFTINGGK